MNKSFRISLADGSHFDANAGESLLAAAQRAHWLVRYGCRNGNCDACAARLLHGRVRLVSNHDNAADDYVIAAPAAKILLCLCAPISDLQIVLPDDPRPGSVEKAFRSYARLQQQMVSKSESVLHFVLPAGRRPTLLPNQIALIETDTGLLQGHINHAMSHGRELIVTLSFASPLQDDAYYHVRYPLSADHIQDGDND